MPAAVAAAKATTFQEVGRENEKTGTWIEIAIVAVRHRFGMDGGNARVVNIVGHTCDARRLRDAQNLFVSGLAALRLCDAGRSHGDHRHRGGDLRDLTLGGGSQEHIAQVRGHR